MSRSLAELKGALCDAFAVHSLEDGTLVVATPFLFPDGDAYPVFVRETEGGFEICDESIAVGRWYDGVAWTPALERSIRSVADATGGELGADWVFRVRLSAPPTAYDVADFVASLAQLGSPGLVQLARSVEKVPRHQAMARQIFTWLGRWVTSGYRRDWHPDQDPSGAWKADAWVPGEELPVVLFAVGTQGTADRAANIAGRYRDWDLEVQPLVAYRPMNVRDAELARLREMVSAENVVAVPPDAPDLLHRALLDRRAMVRPLVGAK